VETPGSPHPYLLRPFLALAFGLLAAACAVTIQAPVAPLPSAAAPAMPAPTTTEPYAVLLRQSQQSRGLPGFGDNALPAVSGEYRLFVPGDAAGVLVGVWATDAALYFAPESWSARRTAASSGYGRAEADRVLSAWPLSADAPWTLLFAVPADAPSVLTENVLARFFGEALGRFAHFLGTAKAYGDVSLPAIVAF